VFTLTLSVDENYLFNVEQRVANNGAAPVAVSPYAFVNRKGVSPDLDTWTIHSGAMGVFNGAADYINVDRIRDVPQATLAQRTTGGWLGFTDHFWLGAVIPDQRVAVDTSFRRTDGAVYQADFSEPERILAPGTVRTSSTRIFAGAKETDVLDNYADSGITLFDYATDWGWFAWFAKPIFYLLDWLFTQIGNFGFAIMALTLIIRLVMFPIAQRQFASMAQMRIVQPKVKALQEKYKDDKQRQQQEMMQLYKTEKINPLAGCLPIVIQIPIFYALYKVLMLTVEMRHQPFALWIKDLSAPDPAMILNLFGLLPFTPPAFLGIGVLAVLLGISMYVQFKLNPPMPDPVQAQIFALMPWMLMFVMAPFAAGLLLYWITNNILTIAQQRLLYARYPEMKAAMAKS
jgi:YidC/Oxa1 family membrane protein insertase